MTWNEISLHKFNELKEILLDEELSHEDKLLYEIQILFNVQDPNKLKIHELHYYINELKFLDEKIPNMKLKDTYVLGDTKYTLNKRIQDFTVAQWIDFQGFMRSGGSDTDNFSNLLSIFFFPEGQKEYNDGYDIDKVRRDIDENLSIADAVSISAFFLNFHKASLVNFLLYTKRMMKKQPLTKIRKKVMNLEIKEGIKKIIFGA